MFVYSGYVVSKKKIYCLYIRQKCLPVCRSLLEGDGRGGGKGGQKGRGQWGGGISPMDVMDCFGGHRL